MQLTKITTNKLKMKLKKFIWGTACTPMYPEVLFDCVVTIIWSFALPSKRQEGFMAPEQTDKLKIAGKVGNASLPS